MTPKRMCLLVLTAMAPLELIGQNAVHEIAGEEVASHRLGDLPVIRIDTSKLDPEYRHGCINVHVSVNSDGSVPGVAADSTFPLNLLPQAEASVRAVKYEPFERNGRAVHVEFDECVWVLSPERNPSRHVPFPTIRDWNSLRIRLERTRCFGSCPDYSVEIHGDGTVRYFGGTSVAVSGEQLGTISRKALEQLVTLFRDTDYYSLDDEYVEHAFDLPTFETSIEIEGKKKKVKDYAGLWVGMPMSVYRLENAIDQAAGTKRWIRSDAEPSHGRTIGK